MPHPTADFPFAYRLPTDVAAQIQGTSPALATMGSPRRRVVVLVLVVGVLGGGMAAAATLPGGAAHSMVKQECLYDLEAGSNSTNDPVLCL